MNDGATPINIAAGILVCIASIIITNFMLGYNYIDAFSLPLLKLIKYVGFMLVAIYVSGIQATCMIITGKIQPDFVECQIDKRVKSPFLHNVIASSITLTPGTITVENKDGLLTVLCLHRRADDPPPSAQFEPQIIKIQESLDTEKESVGV